MRFGRIFYVIVIFVCLLEMARLWNIAPEQMAAHFNIQGDPDRFLPKAQFFWFEIQTFLVVILVSLPLQLLFLVLPPSLINMPNREYWLASGRRAETLGRLSSFGAMLFGVILLVIQAAFEISVYANLQTPIVFNAPLMTLIMVASITLIVLMLVELALSFRLPDAR